MPRKTSDEIYQIVCEMIDGICSAHHEINISSYLNPRQPNNLNDILRRFVVSSQNSSQMTRVINYEGKRSFYENILNHFDPISLSKKDALNLYYLFRQKPPHSKRDCWLKWCKSIVSCANFLRNFSSLEDFQKLGDFFLRSHDPTTQAGFPVLISAQVYGLNFPLCCDALKELGYTEFAKPDSQIEDVLEKSSLLARASFDDAKTYAYKSEIQIAEIANKVTIPSHYVPPRNVTPYELDKLIWLLCSGKFYLCQTPPDVPSYKKRLIDSLKSGGARV